MEITGKDLEDLREAKALLENPGIAAKLTNFIGMPIEKAFDYLPEKWNEKVGEITNSALLKVADVAVLTMKDTPFVKPKNFWHTFTVAATGAAGGALGFTTMAFELPISTTIMFRSIADIARSHGENINAIDSKLACIMVFALGGNSEKDNAAESGYFAVRAALARSVSEAAKYLAEKGLSEEGAPFLVRMITQIAERFSIQVSEKFAAQAIPILGAFGGAIINTMFIDHFQDMAQGHFIIRRLERTHGELLVKQTYDSLNTAS